MVACQTLVCKLEKMEAHVLLAGVITETLSHFHMHVRNEALYALHNLEQKALGKHARAIMRLLLNAGVRDASGALSIMRMLEPKTLAEFAGIVIEMLWHFDFNVCRTATRTLGHLEQNAITPHMVASARKLDDLDADLRGVAVEALGMLESAALAHQAGIAGLLEDSVCGGAAG